MKAVFVRSLSTSLALTLGLVAAPARACGPSGPFDASMFFSILPSVVVSQASEGSVNSLGGGKNKVVVKKAETKAIGTTYQLQNEDTGASADVTTYEKCEPLKVGTVLTLESDKTGHTLKKDNGEIVTFMPTPASASLLGSSKASARSN